MGGALVAQAYTDLLAFSLCAHFLDALSYDEWRAPVARSGAST